MGASRVHKMAKTYEIVALHERASLTDECAKMLNSEWQRSKGMRARTLEQSNEEFPYNVVMLQKDGEKENVIGHAKLTRVLRKPNSLYISSVIIQDHLRGKGLGKKIMEMIEDHMKPKGFDTLYLRTDIWKFYLKCGYEICDPVQEVLNYEMESRIAQLDAVYQGRANSCDTESCSSESTTRSEEGENKELINQDSSKSADIRVPTPPVAPTPPAAPPLPAPKSSCGGCKSSLSSCIAGNDCEEGECKYWMKKELQS